MTAAVPSQPAGFTLDGCAVGSVVASRHGEHLAEQLAYVNSFLLHPPTSQTFPTTTVTPAVIRIPYFRSYGSQALSVELEVHDAGASGSCQVAIGVSAGSLTPLNGNVLNGVSLIPVRAGGSTFLQSPNLSTAVYDTSNLTPNTQVDLTFTFAQVSAVGAGIERIGLCETPLNDTTPGTAGEIGVDYTWAAPNNPISSGATTDARGWAALERMIDLARTQTRHKFGITTYENTTNAWPITSTTYTAIPFPGLSNDPAFRLHSNGIYGSAVPENAIALVRYQTSTTNTGAVQLTITPDGGSSTTQSVTLPASAGAWSWAQASVAIDGSGARGSPLEVRSSSLTLQAKTSSGTLYVSGVWIFSHES